MKDKVRSKLLGRKKPFEDRIQHPCLICNKPLVGKLKTCEGECRKEIRKRSAAKAGSAQKSHCVTPQGHDGYYDGVLFNSNYELAFYLYCKGIGKNITRYKGDPIKYLDPNGKEHNFYPDFIVDGEITEIKGYESEINLAKQRASAGSVIFFYGKDLREKIFPWVEEHHMKIKDLHSLFVQKKREVASPPLITATSDHGVVPSRSSETP
jgi:hypothetical protein